jgi:hypothetical protein
LNLSEYVISTWGDKPHSYLPTIVLQFSNETINRHPDIHYFDLPPYLSNKITGALLRYLMFVQNDQLSSDSIIFSLNRLTGKDANHINFINHLDIVKYKFVTYTPWGDPGSEAIAGYPGSSSISLRTYINMIIHSGLVYGIDEMFLYNSGVTNISSCNPNSSYYYKCSLSLNMKSNFFSLEPTGEISHITNLTPSYFTRFQRFLNSSPGCSTIFGYNQSRFSQFYRSEEMLHRNPKSNNLHHLIFSLDDLKSIELTSTYRHDLVNLLIKNIKKNLDKIIKKKKIYKK